MNDDLGNRMKDNYENRFQTYLMRRTPVIIRLDGRAFHTLTRNCEKPFDIVLSAAMLNTTLALCQRIQGCKCGYTQSDEISLLLTDFDELTTQAWFDYNVQKIVSISAAMAASFFNYWYFKQPNPYDALQHGVFDSRAFNVPKEEVANYFVWRQKDCIRNSVLMFGQANFSHKDLQGKSQADIHEMLHSKGVNWADLEPRWKNGIFVYKDLDVSPALSAYSGQESDSQIIFAQKRFIIERYLLMSEISK